MVRAPLAACLTSSYVSAQLFVVPQPPQASPTCSARCPPPRWTAGTTGGRPQCRAGRTEGCTTSRRVRRAAARPGRRRPPRGELRACLLAARERVHRTHMVLLMLLFMPALQPCHCCRARYWQARPWAGIARRQGTWSRCRGAHGHVPEAGGAGGGGNARQGARRQGGGRQVSVTAVRGREGGREGGGVRPGALLVSWRATRCYRPCVSRVCTLAAQGCVCRRRPCGVGAAVSVGVVLFTRARGLTLPLLDRGLPGPFTTVLTHKLQVTPLFRGTTVVQGARAGCCRPQRQRRGDGGRPGARQQGRL